MSRSSSDSSPDRKKKKKKDKKSKKSHRHERTVSVSSSDEFTAEMKMTEQLASAREQARERKRAQKEAAKALETPEEKRARRLAKKMAKEEKRKQNMGMETSYLGYSNLDNPFGDNHLTDTFVWSKKLEKAGIDKIDVDTLKEQTRRRIVQNHEELEYFKKVREQREKEREDREMMRRDEENKQFSAWSQSEDKFHLQQAKLRSKIRVKESRAKAIDLLARYIALENGEVSDDDDDMETEIIEPDQYMNGLSERDLEDLLADIKVYRTLEYQNSKMDRLLMASSSKASDVDDYWRDVAIIADAELKKIRKRKEEDADRREGIHGAVKSDIDKIFKGKSAEELALLETNIQRKIKLHEAGVDIGYWESLLGHLKVYMAQARLRKRHQHVQKVQIDRIRKNQIKKGEAPPASVKGDKSPVEEETEEKNDNEDVLEKIEWHQLSKEDKDAIMSEIYEIGNYSPVYAEVENFGGPDASDQQSIFTEEADKQRLSIARLQQKQSGHASAQGETTRAIEAMEKEAMKGMAQDETSFAVEAPVEQIAYLWSDKYKPRKPRYFNRVQTGFEWNKYNQTHYDLDNPPPKMVLGYRFNIFYPDLLDTTKTPSFAVYQTEDPDFAIIKFSAGAPYEDIAFKIVNKEWEIDTQFGYRCAFQNGILQLWFTFKKWRYRR